MKASELIEALRKAIEEHGDLEVRIADVNEGCSGPWPIEKHEIVKEIDYNDGKPIIKLGDDGF